MLQAQKEDALEQLNIKGGKRIFKGRDKGALYRFYAAPGEIYLELDYGECGYLHQYSLKENKGIFLLTIREQYNIDPHLIRNHKINTVVVGECAADAVDYMVQKILEKMSHEKVRVNIQQLEASLRNALA